MPNAMTIFTTHDRDAAQVRLLSLLEGDPRIDAAVIAGSIGEGQADRWSDVDIAAVVDDAADCEGVTADWVDRMYREWPIAHHYETSFGTTLVRGFLLENALVLDLGFTPSRDFEVWAPVRVAFDRTGLATGKAAAPQRWAPTPAWGSEAGFAFHDVVHACSAASRGRPWQAAYYLGRVRNRTLALASERRGFDADEFAHVDDLPATERDPLIGSLIGALDRSSLFAGIGVALEGLLAELARGDPDLAARLAPPLRALVEAAAP
jgi:hypothetical protein